MALVNLQKVHVQIAGLTFEVFANPSSAPDQHSQTMAAIMLTLAQLDQRVRDVETVTAYMAPELTIALADADTREAAARLHERVAIVRQMLAQMAAAAIEAKRDRVE